MTDSNSNLDELLQHVTNSPVKGQLYLKLLHGRKDPNEQMEEWGSNGSNIGPLSWCHITYLSSINIGFLNGSDTAPMLHKKDGMCFIDDMLYFNGIYYGDWELFIA